MNQDIGLSSSKEQRPVFGWSANSDRTLLTGETSRRVERQLAPLKKIKLKRRSFACALLLSDFLAFYLALWMSDLTRGQMLRMQEIGSILALGFPLYCLLALQTGAHDPSLAPRAGGSAYRATMAFAVTAAIFFVALFFAKIGPAFSRLFVGRTLVACFIFGAAGRYGIALFAKAHLKPAVFANLCIYDNVPFTEQSGPGAISASDAGLGPDLADPEKVTRLGNLARGMDRVIVHCPPGRREAWARSLKCIDIRSEIVIPELEELMPLGIAHRSGGFSLVLANGPLLLHQRLSKRMFDLAVTIAAIPLALPLILLIAGVVKLDSRGPAFFVQPRIGLGNRQFRIWKFRTMHSDQCDEGGCQSTSRGDRRVTRVGRILRRTSLDELPQLFNVLAGDMSIVGPRPHATGSRAEDRLFWDIDQRYWHRHSIKPGITGLAQIHGLRGTAHKRGDLEKRLNLDLEYATNWSLLTDIKIILLTVRAMTHPNAY